MKNWLCKILGGQKQSAQQKPDAEVTQPAQGSAEKVADVEATQPAATYAPQDPQALKAAEEHVAAEWKVGDVILDLYEVKHIHEGGGMGRVYRVHHRGWNLDLAVKSPRANYFQTEAQKENFTRECETWINLGLYPHIVSCHYVRRLGGIPRVFAEYVEGGTLKEWIDSRKLYEGGPEVALKRIVDIAIQMAWGLHHAHEQGVIHQDVKPGNVLMMPDGTAKIADFGLAKAMATAGETLSDDKQRSILVSSGGMTPAYCSPEQANKQPLSRKTDIWSWAVSVLEMFVGEVCWQSGTAAPEVLKRLSEVRVEDVSVPEMPEALCELLRGCFEPDAAKRPKDAKEISRFLVEIFHSEMREDYIRTEPAAVHLADGFNNRGVSLLDLGKHAEAEQCFDEALKADPHHLESTYNLGLLLWRAAKITNDELVRRLEAIGATHGGNWRHKYLLACVHLEHGDAESAIRLFEECQGASSDDPEVQARLRQAKGLLPESSGCIRSFEAHWDQVTSVSFSPNGKQALSGSRDTTLKLWDLTTGQCVRRFEGHMREVNSVCISPDGRQALSGSDDNTLKLWDLDTGRCQHTFEGQREQKVIVYSVCISPNGRQALSGSMLLGSSDKTVKLWDLTTGRCVRDFEGHMRGVSSVCISPDGHLGLSGGFDQTLKLWNLTTGRCLRIFEGHTGGVNSVCISPDGRLALSGSHDATLKLWDLSSGRCLLTFKGHTDGVYSVCISPDGRQALSGSDDNSLRLWDLTTGRCLRSFEGHTGRVWSVCISPDSRMALSGSEDKTLNWWRLGNSLAQSPAICRPQASELITARAMQVSKVKAQALACLASNAASEAYQAIVLARQIPGHTRDSELLELQGRAGLHGRVVGLALATYLRSFEGHTNSVNSVCISPDGRQALSGSGDQTLKLWELATGRCLRNFEGHAHAVESVCISPDSRLALSGSVDHTLKLWELATGRCLREFEDTHVVSSVVFSPEGRLALSGSLDNTLKLWDLATGRCVRCFEGHTKSVCSVCISPDGRLALSGSHDATLKLWDLSSGRCLLTFKGHTDGVYSVCISPDGRQALSGSEDHTLKLWDLSSGRCLRSFEGHTDRVCSVCISPDGRLALSGSLDKSLKLWDLVVGQCLRSFAEHTQWVSSVGISPDGRQALSGSWDNTLRLWQFVWEYEFPTVIDWNDGARLHLANFLTLHTPAAGQLPTDREPTEEEVQAALTCRGKPTWTEDDFKRLLHGLGCAGYGWLRPDGVRRKLEELASNWQGPSPVPPEVKVTQTDPRSPSGAEDIEVTQSAVTCASQDLQARRVPGYTDATERLVLQEQAGLHGQIVRLTTACCLRILKGDTDDVCISPDGRQALSGSWDKTLKLWDLATGRCLSSFEGHTKSVCSVCISPDGRLGLSGSGDKTLKLWDLATGQCLRTFEGHTAYVESVCISPDGRLALSGGGYDKSLKLWDLGTGRCLRSFEGHTGGVDSVCIFPDGRLALSGSVDDILKLWDLATGQCLRTFEGHTKSVCSVCICPDGRLALSGSHDATLKLWDLATGRCLRDFTGHTDEVESVCLSPDGRLALSGSWDNTMRLWDLATGRCIRSFAGHTEEVCSVCISPDGRQALSGSKDGTMRLWQFNWEYEFPTETDWDEGAHPHLANFLTLHTPAAGQLPTDREPTEEEVQAALTRRGRPSWTEDDFKRLLHTLGCAGYGWLRPEGVRQQLEKMTGDWQGPPPMPWEQNS